MGKLAAWFLAAVAGALAITAVAIAFIERVPLAELVETFRVTNTAMGVGFAGCGTILAVQRARNPIGWLLQLAGIAHLSTAAFGVDVPAWGLGICLFLPLALQLFPDGKPVTRRWAWAVPLTVLFGLLFVAIETPVTNSASLFGFVVAIAGLIVRYRRGDERLRRQLLWLVLALIAAVALNLPRWIVGDGPILLLLAVPLIPAAITVAILRYQLLDIRLVVSRALLYLLLSIAVAGAYLGLVGAFELLLRRDTGVPVVATLLIALAFNPVRVWLQRTVDRLMYGSRSDPIRAVSQVGARLAADDLAGVLAGIRDALRLPYAALLDSDGRLSDGRLSDGRLSNGQPPERFESVPLAFRGEAVGELIVGVRRGEAGLGEADRAVLDLLAAPLAAALHATALARQVQASRERIVAAREEERRRLHRDLHDGLGPTLTGAGYKADAASNLVASSPERAGALILELRADIGNAIADVRRVVYGLRPPALDEVGLVGALRRHCERLPIDVTFDAPALQLPAAVEVAAYRIVTEALTNAVRHGRARHARVSVTVDDAVTLSIVDDGDPGPAPWDEGVGLTSIRERAAELGGRSETGPTPTGGSVVAVLPLGVPA